MSNHPETDCTPAQRARDQAIDWFSRASLRRLSADEQRAFEKWRTSDPLHDRHYRILEQAWRAADAVPREQWRAITAQPAEKKRRIRWLSLPALSVLTVCAVALLVIVAGLRYSMQSPIFEQHIATAKGEKRQLALPDGSILEINTDTVVDVRFYDDRRVVDLPQGEIYFSVKPDSIRPFHVMFNGAQLRVTGTAFNVLSDPVRSSVAVKEGTVEVSSGHWWNEQSVSLHPGYAVQVSDSDTRLQPYAEDMNAVLAWQRGRLIFNDSRLEDVVNTINRYLSVPLRIADPELRDLRIAASVDLGKPELLLDMLPKVAPVIIARGSDGSQRIQKR